MSEIILWILNVGMIAAGIYLFFIKKDLLSYFKGGRLWLTWLAVGCITLMDELSSIFYAPSEAFRFIGPIAIFFIPLTALLIRYLTTRMVEIAEILDYHGLRGGGVYNFSYFVLGPLVSFVAVSSIMVTYILTAAISTVSAVENATSFISLGLPSKLVIEMIIVWLICVLNILGIRENARITFGITLVTSIIIMNLIVTSLFQVGPESVAIVQQSVVDSWHGLTGKHFFAGYAFFIIAISNCILAYSGIESVLQTATLVEDWKVIRKAYLFLALTVGLITPIISVLALSHAGIDFRAHETDLITHLATVVRGPVFGVTVAALASIILMMALNTAYVASGELVERVCHRYGFHWLIKTNKRASLYRIHIANAIFFSVIILITQGGQGALAEMYAVGLVASFLINLTSLLIYRYSKGTKEVAPYNVSRVGTLILFLIVLSCFSYLCYEKPQGFILWLLATVFALIVGFYGTRRRSPELKEIQEGETPMDIILYIAESECKNVNINFKRPSDTLPERQYDLSLLVTFYSPRQKIPDRVGPNHFRIAVKRANVIDNIKAILTLFVYELADRNMTVHFGWPTSSWIDRLSTGVMVFQFMQLPKVFPDINFKIEQFRSSNMPTAL